MLAQAAASTVTDVGRRLPDAAAQRQPVLVANARNAVYDFAEDAMAEAARALGTAAHFDTHPVAERLSDLSMYIRQPGPDAQHLHVARAVAAGTLDVVA